MIIYQKDLPYFSKMISTLSKLGLYIPIKCRIRNNDHYDPDHFKITYELTPGDINERES